MAQGHDGFTLIRREVLLKMVDHYREECWFSHYDPDADTIDEVVGIFDLVTHRVWTAPRADAKATFREVILADAPTSLAEFEELATRIAVRATKRVSAKD